MKNAVRAAWALALLLGLTPALASAETSGALHDGVVVDAARGTAYVISPKGGIDALDLATGNVRWTSKAAAKPLAVVDGALLAQVATMESGELPVVALDAAGNVKQQMRIQLPSGVKAQAADGPTRYFRAEAFEAEDGSVVVTWAASESRPVQGILPPAQDGTQAPGTVETASSAEPLAGAARLDLAAGRVAEVPSVKAQSLQLAARAAFSGKGLDLRRQLASLDGKHVLTAERIAESGAQRRYRWTITDAAGATVGTVESPVGRAPFVVAGSQVLYVAPRGARVEGSRIVEEPLRLQALDLRTGAAVWSAEVVDTTFRGPFPP